MNPHQIEDQYIRSLDQPMSPEDQDRFQSELNNHPELIPILAQHDRVRSTLSSKEPASFGPYFAAKVMHRIEHSKQTIDAHLFSFFKRFQWAAAAAVIGLVMLNIWTTQELSFASVLGLDQTVSQDTEIVKFDYYRILNEEL